MFIDYATLIKTHLLQSIRTYTICKIKLRLSPQSDIVQSHYKTI